MAHHVLINYSFPGIHRRAREVNQPRPAPARTIAEELVQKAHCLFPTPASPSRPTPTYATTFPPGHMPTAPVQSLRRTPNTRSPRNSCLSAHPAPAPTSSTCSTKHKLTQPNPTQPHPSPTLSIAFNISPNSTGLHSATTTPQPCAVRAVHLGHPPIRERRRG